MTPFHRKGKRDKGQGERDKGKRLRPERGAKSPSEREPGTTLYGFDDFCGCRGGDHLAYENWIQAGHVDDEKGRFSRNDRRADDGPHAEPEQRSRHNSGGQNTSA